MRTARWCGPLHRPPTCPLHHPPTCPRCAAPRCAPPRSDAAPPADAQITSKEEEAPSTWEVSGPNSVVVHCFAQPHELTLSRFRLEFESRNLELGDGYVLHRGYLKHG